MSSTQKRNDDPVVVFVCSRAGPKTEQTGGGETKEKKRKKIESELKN